MFYFETPDGNKYSSKPGTDDQKEFRNIIEQHLGSDAADIFDDLLTESEKVSHKVLSQYKSCINALAIMVDSDELNKERIESLLQKLKDIYIDLS